MAADTFFNSDGEVDSMGLDISAVRIRQFQWRRRKIQVIKTQLY
jgi:hypothetical protein